MSLDKWPYIESYVVQKINITISFSSVVRARWYLNRRHPTSLHLHQRQILSRHLEILVDVEAASLSRMLLSLVVQVRKLDP